MDLVFSVPLVLQLTDSRTKRRNAQLNLVDSRNQIAHTRSSLEEFLWSAVLVEGKGASFTQNLMKKMKNEEEKE